MASFVAIAPARQVLGWTHELLTMIIKRLIANLRDYPRNTDWWSFKRLS